MTMGAQRSKAVESTTASVSLLSRRHYWKKSKGEKMLINVTALKSAPL